LIACILLTLGAALGSGIIQFFAVRSKGRAPVVTLVMLVLVAAMFCVQLAVPNVLPLMERNGSLLRRGEIWRAVTALFAQDGWLPGSVFNMAILVLIGAMAEQKLGPTRWLVVYLGAGIATEFLAHAWQPQGAGNSIAVFGLAGAIIAQPVRRLVALQIPARLVAAAAAAGLLMMRDIHGIGFWLGAMIAAPFAIMDARTHTHRANALA
jgi:membrane associated rhomboid family serine protease